MSATSTTTPAWLPLTTAQFEVWFACQLNPRSSAYNLADYYDIRGSLDLGIFEIALQQAADECLLPDVRIDEDVDGPYQVIGDRTVPLVHVIDVSADAEPMASAQEWMARDQAEPTDLIRDRLWHDVLIKLADDEYCWYTRCHHIVADAYSSSLIGRRVAELYTAAVRGQPPLSGTALRALPNLIRAEKDYRASAQYAHDREYWLGRFADLPEPVTLAASAADRAVATAAGPGAQEFVTVDSRLGEGLRMDLDASARQARTTRPVLIFAAMGLLLGRAAGTQEVTVGVPVSARPNGVRRTTPGMVSNELPLRLRVRSGMTKAELLRHTAARLSELLAHQCYPYEELRRDLKLRGRDLFGAAVNILDFSGEDLKFGDFPASVTTLRTGPVKDLVVTVYSESKAAGLRLIYTGDPALYTEADLAGLHDRFAAVLASLAALDADAAVSGVAVADAATSRVR